MAAKKGSVEMVSALIAAGADVNGATGGNPQPLYAACSVSNNEKVVKILLEAGAGVDNVYESGSNRTPLMRAVTLVSPNNLIETIKALIKAGADVNKVDEDGDSVLYLALARDVKNDPTINADRLAIAKLLIDAGASVHNNTSNPKLSGGKVPIMCASAYWYSDIVKLIIDSGADINAITQGGNDALYVAINNNPDEKVIETLLAAGANPNRIYEKKKFGHTNEKENLSALSYALTGSRSSNVAKTLIKAGADINHPSVTSLFNIKEDGFPPFKFRCPLCDCVLEDAELIKLLEPAAPEKFFEKAIAMSTFSKVMMNYHPMELVYKLLMAHPELIKDLSKEGESSSRRHCFFGGPMMGF
jgi:ankyrin repeat protein